MRRIVKSVKVVEEGWTRGSRRDDAWMGWEVGQAGLLACVCASG